MHLYSTCSPCEGTHATPEARVNRRNSMRSGFVALMLFFGLLAPLVAAAAGRQYLVVSSAYWGKTYSRFTYDVFDLDDGGKRIHRAKPADVGEIRGMAFSPATQRLYVAGHQGLLCYAWPDFTMVWRKPVEGENGKIRRQEQNDAIAVTVDGARIYTVRHFGKGMNVYDAATGERLRVIHEAEMPMWGRFSQVTHDGKRLFASNGNIFIIDTATDAILTRFKPVSEPVRFMLSADGKRFVYATGRKRTVAIHATEDGKLLHEVAVPDWEGMPPVTPKARPSLKWLALSPDGSRAWACDPAYSCFHHFDLAADPPAYGGRVGAAKHSDGLMFSVDGRFLVTGSGAILAPSDGTSLGHLVDEGGKRCEASNSMLALEADATGRIVRTNQQCAPAWQGGSVSTSADGEEPRPPVSAPGGKVLIVRKKGAFRDALAKALSAAVVGKGATAEIVDPGAGVAADTTAHAAVVVVTDVPEWSKTRTVSSLLAGKDRGIRRKLIVITSARKKTWKPKDAKGVDAVTCASKKNEISDLVRTTASKIAKLLQVEKP